MRSGYRGVWIVGCCTWQAVTPGTELREQCGRRHGDGGVQGRWMATEHGRRRTSRSWYRNAITISPMEVGWALEDSQSAHHRR